MSDQVLVIGSGGREHAIAWKLALSPQVQNVFVAPGNAGTYSSGKISNVDVNVKDFQQVSLWCREESVSLVVVGPEDPLAEGIADHLQQQGIACFGPCAAAARIEASKSFSKDFMTRHSIPTARWRAFTDYNRAANYINTADHDALVVKASGLAAGKGVIVAKGKAEACQAAKDILLDAKFGKAGCEVVIEELLFGPEVSCLAFSDGRTIACMPPAQDHKRALDGDLGPNTGGMGAYCPCPLVTEEDLKLIQEHVLQKAVDSMREEGYPYVGVLYAGLMLTKDGPKCLEFNCRFGDPETQVILPLLENDLYTVFQHCVKGTLSEVDLLVKANQKAVGVVAVSGGYPGSYKKGLPITGLDGLEGEKDLIVFHAGTARSGSSVVTSGGRVLALVALNSNMATAAKTATDKLSSIAFTDMFYRKDIAQRAINQRPQGLSYKAAGVDIHTGDQLVSQIKPLAASTARPGCTADLGMFGGLFDLKAAGYNDPLLVSGTDGVGTKLKLAQSVGLHHTVGEDLVAMCVNDILCHGAEPLFFLDYFACGRLELGVAQRVIEGVANGCKISNAALLGGETAEMPGMYQDGEYDLAGFAVGAVDRHRYLPNLSTIVEGDVLITLPSSGVHSNGFSLVRKVVERSGLALGDPCPWDATKTLGEALLTPTTIYTTALLPLLKAGGKVKALAHITGGGLPGNVNRILPKHLAVTMDALAWPVPPVFTWIQKTGDVETSEMARTFNCGVGMVVVVSSKVKDEVLGELTAAGMTAAVTGCVHHRTEGSEQVIVNNLDVALQRTKPVKKKVKVGVLISGSGTNLQALIDHTRRSSYAEISLVISNKPGVQGLTRAQKAGIATKVIKHAGRSRESFEEEVHAGLVEAGVEIVCLAGFMRILTGGFVRLWEGRMLNVHPSLLPVFKGAHAHKLVLEAGVRVSGCTVHFVAEDVDAGAILVQEVMPVHPTDTEETLSERVKTLEHKAFPRALELLASRQVKLGNNGKLHWL